MEFVLVKDTVISTELVKYINITDILDKGNEVSLHISLPKRKDLNIIMDQDEAEQLIATIISEYPDYIRQVEGYAINMDRVEYATIDYVDDVVRLQVEFDDTTIFIPMTKEKAKEYLGIIASI